MSPEQHLDLDALADALTGEASLGAEEHLTGCATCRAGLDELRAASAEVTRALASLPPVDLPDEIGARLRDALREAGPADTAATTGSANVTPFPAAEARAAHRNPMRWLTAAAAAVVLLAGGIYGVSQLGSSDSGSSTAAGSGGAEKAAPDLARNSSGEDYTDRASLAAAVPDLLGGRRQAADSAKVAAAPTAAATTPQQAAGTLTAPAPDPLARLRDNKGLADCLLALLPPDDPSVQPLALDYASFRGQPAMVVVLPAAAADKLDVFVVGPGCSQANDSVVFYTSVDKP